MSKAILKVEGISKQYRLGLVGTGSLVHDLNRFWHRIRGKEDPYLKLGAINDRSAKATEDYVWALQDINFDVQEGEVLGIIGKNGAGKSTLLKLLSRVTSPTTGVIKSKGRIASLLEVGTGFHPELTGRENIYLNGAILGMTKAEITDKIDEIIEFSGCEMYIDTPTKRYSSGMTVRLAFAVAAHLEPDILVIDEVLAVGDAEFQKKAIGKMQDISKGEGRTVLFVSHNMDSVLTLCTRAILLEHGSLSLEGATDVVVEEYLSRSSEKSQEDLTKRTDRIGTAAIKCTKIEMLSTATDRVIPEIVSGMGVVFRISLEVFDKTLIGEEINIGLTIRNRNGTFVTVLNNKMTNVKLYINEEKAYFDCRLDKAPFTLGEFRVDFNLQRVKTKEFFDRVETAFVFTVHDGDFYQSGTKNAFGRQGLYIDQNWILNE
ncbi:MAG: ABC transporter ATP-binding protein [Gilvibacter sp.]